MENVIEFLTKETHRISGIQTYCNPAFKFAGYPEK